MRQGLCMCAIQRVNRRDKIFKCLWTEYVSRCQAHRFVSRTAKLLGFSRSTGIPNVWYTQCIRLQDSVSRVPYFHVWKEGCGTFSLYPRTVVRQALTVFWLCVCVCVCVFIDRYAYSHLLIRLWVLDFCTLHADPTELLGLILYTLMGTLSLLHINLCSLALQDLSPTPKQSYLDTWPAAGDRRNEEEENNGEKRREIGTNKTLTS